MAVVVKQLKFGDVTHPIVYSSNALFKLEEKTGLSTERIGLLLVSGRAGYQMMHYILWAGLEAARVRMNTRREPFTLDEVGDLLDVEGGAATVWASADDGMAKKEVERDGVKHVVTYPAREPREEHPIAVSVQEAWGAAFPQPRKIEGAEPNPPSASDDQPGMSS